MYNIQVYDCVRDVDSEERNYMTVYNTQQNYTQEEREKRYQTNVYCSSISVKNKLCCLQFHIVASFSFSEDYRRESEINLTRKDIRKASVRPPSVC
jgi:hypothetical protein